MDKKIFALVLPSLLVAGPALAASKTDMQEQTQTLIRETRTQMVQPAGKQMVTETRTQVSTERTVRPVLVGSEAHQQFTKGQWFLVEKNYPEAIRSFEQALTLSPDYVAALRGLACAQQMRGEFEPALTHIDRAISIDPINSELLLTRAEILEGLKREPQALEDYLTFLSLVPEDSARIDVLRRANELYGKLESKLTATQREYFGGLRSLAMGNVEQSVPQLRQFISRETTVTPQVINAHRLLGVAYESLQRPTEAVAVWEVITKQQPQNPVGYYHLSSTYEQVGRREQAQQAWSNFVKYAPKSQAYFVERPLLGQPQPETLR